MIHSRLAKERIIQQARTRRAGKLRRDKKFRDRVIRWAKHMRLKRKSARSLERKLALDWRGYAIAAKLKKHGLSVDQYLTMLEVQGNGCAVCRAETVGDSRSKDEFSWHIDHDHTTGKVRGLLCLRCNVALGQISDDCDILRAMISYLEKQETNLFSPFASVKKSA